MPKEEERQALLFVLGMMICNYYVFCHISQGVYFNLQSGDALSLLNLQVVYELIKIKTVLGPREPN